MPLRSWREFGAVELRDRTCLIVGYGAIGRRIARLAAAFAMRVVVADPHRGSDVAGDGHAAASLDQALPDFRRSSLRAHADDARPDRRRAARADEA